MSSTEPGPQNLVQLPVPDPTIEAERIVSDESLLIAKTDREMLIDSIKNTVIVSVVCGSIGLGFHVAKNVITNKYFKR